VSKLTGLTRLCHKGRRTVPAVRDLDLVIADGEWLAVQGRTGHGKSTLLNLLGGLDRPTLGKSSCRTVPQPGERGGLLAGCHSPLETPRAVGPVASVTRRSGGEAAHSQQNDRPLHILPADYARKGSVIPSRSLSGRHVAPPGNAHRGGG
jgi:energy-coupling factor transporter ATP-binding protein EcfA2